MPKEMLPIVHKTVVQFVVEEAIIADIIFITGRGKSTIGDYFDSSPELETPLGQNEKYELLKEKRCILIRNV